MDFPPFVAICSNQIVAAPRGAGGYHRAADMASGEGGTPHGPKGTRSGHPGRNPWTQDQLALLYFFLPLMRTLCDLTGREFSAIAMKFGNLLAVETTNREGLANASALDREIVRKYRHDRPSLERAVMKVVVDAGTGAPKAEDLQLSAIDLLRESDRPLSAETISYLLAARSPTAIPTPGLVREVLRTSSYAAEVAPDVFRYRSDPENRPTGGS